MSRQAKTPRQRAEEALAVEIRRVKRLTSKRDGLRAEVDEVQAELDDATRRCDYLSQHPDPDPATTELPIGGAS